MIGIALRNAGFGLQFNAAGDSFDSPAVDELGGIIWSGEDESQVPQATGAPVETVAQSAPQTPPEPEDPLEKAMNTPCPISKYSGRTLGQVLREDPHAILWVANKFRGDPEISSSQCNSAPYKMGGPAFCWPSPGEERSMELRYQMTDILPLLPIPQPPHGRSSYNIPCPVCDRPGTREKHLNINLKRNVYRCPKCGQFQGGVFDLYAYYMGVSRDKVLEDVTARLNGETSKFSGKVVSKRKLESPPMKPQASLAPLDERDRVYRALLNRLTLAPDHRENLLRRGLTDEAIERLGYKSTPVVGFHALAQSLLDEGYTLFGVPGFYRDEDGRWTMAVWRRGIMIPGTYFGKIQGFQIRLDNKMKKGGKILTFSSRDELDGAMGENWCHLVGPVRERILLIEGYMKADIVNHFTGQTILAVPGVTSLQHLEAALRDLIPLGVRHVTTCFDMDYLKNWHVENAYKNLVALLGKMDITFGTYLWVPDHNGLDDYIWDFCLNRGESSK